MYEIREFTTGEQGYLVIDKSTVKRVLLDRLLGTHLGLIRYENLFVYYKDLEHFKNGGIFKEAVKYYTIVKRQIKAIALP